MACFSLALTGLLWVSTGLATGLSDAERPVFVGVMTLIDTDGNGEISRAEYDAKATDGDFGKLDWDKSGGVDLDELARWIKTAPPRPGRSQKDTPGGPAAHQDGRAPAPDAAGGRTGAPVGPAGVAERVKWTELNPMAAAPPVAAEAVGGAGSWWAAVVGGLGVLAAVVLGVVLATRGRPAPQRRRRRRR